MRPHVTRAALFLLLPLLLADCGRGDNERTESAGGNVTAERATTVDTGNALSVTPAEGGVAKLTPTDEKSVSTAGKFKLTDDNFRKFTEATDSVLSLRARDPSVRAFLDANVTDTGNDIQVKDIDAGLKRLQNNATVSNAITSTGMSVRDYFVAAIAIAQAERFMGDPSAAVHTATLRPNAEFPDPWARGLLARRKRARNALRVWSERLDVPINRAKVALVHLRRVPPRHGWMAIAAIGGLEHIHPVILRLTLRDGAEVLAIGRAPLAPEAHVQPREAIGRRNLALGLHPALRVAVVAASHDGEILTCLLHALRLHGGPGGWRHRVATRGSAGARAAVARTGEGRQGDGRRYRLWVGKHESV